jgi:hypothetical protein
MLSYRKTFSSFIILMLLFNLLSTQIQMPTSSEYPSSGKRYITTEDGIIITRP